MKLIAKDSAIAGMRLIADEVKPLNGFNLAVLLGGVAERYEFSLVPSVKDALTNGAKFQHGRLIGQKQINISELGIFNDALSVTTTDTSDSELVINDLFGFLKENYGLRDPITAPIRGFQSDLIVDLVHDPDESMRAFAPLWRLLEAEVESIDGSKKKTGFTRIDFGSDPASLGPRALFIIERRAAAPLDSRRFFCKAYMRTEAHIRALELLDEILGKRG